MVCGLVGVRVRRCVTFTTRPKIVARITRSPATRSPRKEPPNETARTREQRLKD